MQNEEKYNRATDHASDRFIYLERAHYLTREQAIKTGEKAVLKTLGNLPKMHCNWHDMSMLQCSLSWDINSNEW